MTKHKWSGLIAIGVAAIVVLGMALGLALYPKGDASAKPSNEIAKSVCQFEGAPISDLQLMRPLLGSNLTMVKSNKTEYGFNPESRRIELALYGGNFVGNEVVSVTQEEAETIATQFAQKHCDNLPVFTLQTSELRGFDKSPNTTATVMRVYEFEWVQVIDGALTPNSVLVDVNPGTGNVMAYIYRYQPIESAGTPSLTSEDAKAVVANRVLETARAALTAESKLSPEVSFLQDPELRIVVKDGKEILVWRMIAEAQGDLPWAMGGQYDINAQNGSIVEENPFL